MQRAKLCCSKAIAVMLMTLLLAGSALAATLVSDPNAIPAWRGTQRFYAQQDDATIDVDVEYAVYQAGAYKDSADPSKGAEYVYAYQVFNDREGGNRPVSSFSVGLDPEADPHDIGSDSTSGTPGGIAPTVSAFSGDPATSAVQYFFGNTIDPPGEYSEVLLFTSPYGPRWAPATVMDSGLSKVENLPSPLPEPAILALLGLGGVFALIRRRK